jgi:hypothetical protein
LRFNLCDHALHFDGDGHVSLNRDCLLSDFPDFAADSIRSVGTLTVVNGNFGTSASQRHSDGGSDPATASRHKSNSIPEVFHPIPYYSRIVKSVQIVNLQLENTGGD